jgi:hypothetical protein
LAHLPPVLARRQSLKTTFSTKVPLRTHAEGGQVEPVLGGHLRRMILKVGTFFRLPWPRLGQ